MPALKLIIAPKIPENRPKPRKESSFPASMFQGQTVTSSFRERITKRKRLILKEPPCLRVPAKVEESSSTNHKGSLSFSFRQDIHTLKLTLKIENP